MDRIVVITGTSSGIGLATAVAFARAGDTVVATMRDPSRASALEAAASTAGVSVEVLPLDVTSDASVADALARVMDEHGRIDVLVNNAGRAFLATLEEMTMAQLQQSLDVNFMGVARATKAAVPLMRQAGRGHLIAVTSVAGAVGQPFQDAYCAAKQAVEGLYESLCPVAATFGVRVCIVEPGPVATSFNESVERFDSPDAAIATLKSRYLAMMGSGGIRAQPAEEVADVIVGVADQPDPPLRTQTSRFTTRLIERKLADITGENVIALTAPWIAAE
jgi:NAD(P)-dependent dehydrogenase (short-subunit alcohol dehydrogenase family)